MNRFSKDIGLTDDTIPSTVYDFLTVIIFLNKFNLGQFLLNEFHKVLMAVFGSVGMSLVLNIWIVVPMIPLTIFFLYIRKYFLASSMEIKRIEGIARSPIYVHVNNTMSGMSIIRASNMEKKINDEYFIHNDYHTRATSAFLFVNRWLGVRLG